MSMKQPERQFRALINLVYSDIIPEKAGQPLANQGDITPLYPELLKYPDRVKLLIERGFIEEVSPVQIVRPPKEEPKSEE